MENKRIIIMDDESDFVDAFCKTMAAKAYEVIAVAGGVDLQDKMGKAEPDIVVLGTMVPSGEAFRLHRWLKGHPRYRDIPLLVIDARVEERSIRGWRREEGMQLEAEGYASKPIEPAVLVPQIQSMLDLRRTMKVLVVDDHTMVRDGICAVLALQKDIDVVGEAANGKEAIEKVMRLLPNVVLMDIVMPVMSGLEATKRICREYPQSKVLILTQYDEEENMFVAKQAGAFGFIPKKAASVELLNGIRAVGIGRYFPPAFAYVSANWPEGEKRSSVSPE